MCAICYKDGINTRLLAPLVEEEEVTDYGCTDGHHTGKAKTSDGASTD